jgi:hypothetical protein
LFWEYDTRLGRRWNLDPEPQINISDYSAFGNSPIWRNDVLGNTWKKKDDKETANKTKNDVNGKISKIDSQLSKLEKSKTNATEESLIGINKQIGILSDDRKSLSNIIEGLDKMEADQDYTYTFAPYACTAGSEEGLEMLDGTKVGGITTYSLVNGKNFEEKNYSAIIKINYNSFTKTGDTSADSYNTNLSKAFKAHEIIHGMQVAMRKLLIPSNPALRDGEKFTFEPNFIKEEEPYKTQNAYEKY